MLSSFADFATIIDNINNFRVAVIGDYCLDNYYFIDSKLDYSSDYTDLCTYCTSSVKKTLGGAGNVAKNLSALGVSVYPIGFIGNDGAGYDLHNEIVRLGMDSAGLIKADLLATNTYHRFIRDEATTINEVLVLNRRKLGDEIIKQLQQSCENIIPNVDAVIIVEQFSKTQGQSVMESIRGYVQSLALRNEEIFFIADTKYSIHKYMGMYVKCNHHELQESVLGILKDNKTVISDFDVPQIKHCISLLDKNVALFITVGENGTLFYQNGSLKHIKTRIATPPIDTCGAGDSATVGITIGMLLGFEPTKAAIIGNMIASITIRQLNGTGEPCLTSLMTEITKHSQTVNAL